jgi:hypothetical protein
MKSSPTSVDLEISLLAYFTPIIATSCHWLISSLELNFTIFPLASVFVLAVFIRGLSKGVGWVVLLLRVVRVCCSCYCCGLSDFVAIFLLLLWVVRVCCSCYCWGLSECVVPVIIAGCQSLLFLLLLRVVRVCYSCYCCGLSEFMFLLLLRVVIGHGSCYC